MAQWPEAIVLIPGLSDHLTEKVLPQRSKLKLLSVYDDTLATQLEAIDVWVKC